MSIWSLFFPIATIALSVACWACYKTNKPLREKAAKEREELIKKEAAKVEQLKADARQLEITKAVNEALGVLFREAREYSPVIEEDYRTSHYRPRPDRGLKFNRETREVFHKVLRVGALEQRMDNQEEGNKVRRKAINDLYQQVHEIHGVIKQYV
ncbi:MAG: hypothetical protein ACOH2R_17500 [Pseudomonas sp.]